MTGEFKFKQACGGRCYFAHASVQLHEVTTAQEAKTTLDGDFAAHWQASVAFGVDYAMDLARDSRWFRVHVTLQTTVVDSTPAVVAAATARAVLAALGRHDGPLPDLEAVDHRVSFPQW